MTFEEFWPRHLRRWIVWLAAALWLLVAVPAPAALTPHSPVFTDASQTASVAAGEEFFIALPSNRTTGYSWTAKVADEKLLAYEGNVYQAPIAANPPLMGSGGQQLFIFHASRSGTTTVSFAYSRPFEEGQPAAKTATFTVTVQ